MRINVILSLLKKEFLNIIRDRKSFIIMILLPLLMFPLLVGLMSFMMTSFTKVDDEIKFGVNYDAGEDFEKFVQNYSENYDIEIIYDSEENLKEKFEKEELGVYVIKQDNKYLIHYDENNTSNVATNALVENLYKDYKEVYIGKVLEASGIDYEEVKNTFVIDFVQSSITDMGSLVPSIISMVLIMIISSVSFSVAIDLTTSEKEKGTLETLLSLPIKKSELITSKYITVFLLSAMSGFLTYISLFGTLYFAKGTLAMLGVTSLDISFNVLMIYFVSIILLSLLFSGLLLGVTIFSKNLKEAQNSLYPLELLIAFISMLPMFGISGSVKSALIPFVNISLLFNNALSTNVDPIFVLFTFASTVFYAVLLIFVVSKIYNQEDVLFNTKSLSYLTFKNGKSKRDAFSPFASITIAIIIYLLAMYFSLIFISVPKYLLLAIMPLTILFVIIVSSLLTNLDVKESFKLKGFSIKKFISFIFLYLGVYMISNFIMTGLSNIFPSLVEEMEEISSILTFDNLFLSILVIAVLPAIAEELLFRGVILTSFKKKFGMWAGIIISAIIFGVYHMNWIQGINACILGLALGYIFVRSNSIFVPIIFHFLNNAYSVLASYFEWLNFGFTPISTIITLIISIFFVIIVVYYNERASHNQ